MVQLASVTLAYKVHLHQGSEMDVVCPQTVPNSTFKKKKKVITRLLELNLLTLTIITTTFPMIKQKSVKHSEGSFSSHFMQFRITF